MIAFNAQNMHHIADPYELKVDKSEIYRYLGYYRVKPDETISSLIDKCLEDELNVAIPQGIYSIFPISIDEKSCELDLGFAKTTSRHLCKNLSGCSHIALFAATIGPRVDVLIQRTSRVDQTKAVIYQSVGATLIESYCDYLNDYLRREFGEGGYKLRPRYSPGYGDLSILLQKDIFKSIRADKTIGLTLMDTCIMAPSKSVTAIIGIAPGDAPDCNYLPDCNICDVCARKE
ncbi:MAG: Vitamin B12 dependent methionine synthase activation subunit [Lachnospiraceae bacterium]|nr:Vitamin B12 dependent methionine synthase activation subunit [Lachnospiraceae bacterium]